MNENNMDITSPGTHPDVTMDSSYSIGYRSPSAGFQQYQGSTSPAQGRSVREFEEQMANLRKENFNLKLRIYFMEENTAACTKSNNIESQDTLKKQLVDVKVENEILRKEVQEKQDLLKDAAQAMTEMERIQKETETQSQLTVDELNQKMKMLEMEKEMKKTEKSQFVEDLLGRTVDSQSNDFSANQKASGSEEKVIELQQRIHVFESIISQRDITIQEYEDKLKDLVFQNAELLESLENNEKQTENVEVQRLREELLEQKRNFADTKCMLQDAEEKLEERTKAFNEKLQECQNVEEHLNQRTQEYEKAKKGIQKLVKTIKILQTENTTLKSSCAPSEEQNGNTVVMEKLQSELIEARNETERAEKWRKECFEACSVLTIRLEELARFLQSLLKHKYVLSLLSADGRQKMRKAVNQSLDLSLSLNRSLSLGGSLVLEQSFSQILSNLSEIQDQRASNSFHEPINMFSVENQSDSEAWSEPDREISLARIGLEDPMNATPNSHSMSAARLSSTSSIGAVGQANSSDTDVVNSNRSLKAKSLDKISHLEEIIKEKDSRILQIQYQVKEADKQQKIDNLRVIEMSQEIEMLRSQNKQLMADLSLINIQNISVGTNTSCDKLMRQIEQKSDTIEKIKEERDRITVEARLAEMQISNLKASIEDLKEEQNIALTQAQEQEKQKLCNLRLELTQEMEKRIEEQKAHHLNLLEHEWIARSLYEENLRQLDMLRKNMSEAERTIDYLKENEAELKKSLIKNEHEIRAITKNLNESTLQASKAALERTKALNEKLLLETNIKELKVQLSKLTFQNKECTQKIQALEQFAFIKSDKHNSNVSSDIEQTDGFTSEEIRQTQKINSAIKLKRDYSVGLLRQNNSSPDLGIESDDLLPLTMVKTEGDENLKPTAVLKTINVNDNLLPSSSSTIQHDCAQVDLENAELRRKLVRYKRALEDTCNKLRLGNQIKEQIEKGIKNQILKTHNVLKNVRSNMENKQLD